MNCRKNKLLFVTGYLEMGGIAHFMSEIKYNLMPKGQYRIVTASFGNNYGGYKKQLEVDHEIALDSTFDWKAIFATRKLLLAVNPSTIITQDHRSNVIVLLSILCFHLNYPCLTMQRGIPFPMSARIKKYFKIDILLRRVLRQHTIAVSEDTRQRLINDWHLPPTRVSTLHNAISMPLELRQPYSVKEDQPIIFGFAARLRREKGCFDLLESFQKVQHQIPLSRLLIAGHGEAFDELVTFARRLGIDHAVEFLGEVTEMSEFYNRLDLFVFPSYNEGLPWVVLEAMVHGVPVVASNVGGIPEIITDEVDGWLIPVRDIETLTRTMISSVKDKMTLTAVGKQARQTIIERFSFANYYERLTAIIESI